MPPAPMPNEGLMVYISMTLKEEAAHPTGVDPVGCADLILKYYDDVSCDSAR